MDADDRKRHAKAGAALLLYAALSLIVGMLLIYGGILLILGA